MPELLHCARVLTPTGFAHNHTVLINEQSIEEIRPSTDLERQKQLPGTLLPGYIDVQVNGGGGVLFNHTPTPVGIQTICQAHLTYGTTTLLPTLITDGIETMGRAADAIAESMAAGNKSVAGIHFEGPFLSVAKKGVHEARHIRASTDTEIAILARRDIGQVLVTIAPETVSPSLIAELVSQGIVVSLGHSNADIGTVEKALEAGATGFTHLFNAMSAFESRAPGMVGAALSDDDAYCGLIVDHHHLHPQSAKVAIKAKGVDKIMLVTDAMAHVGTDDMTLDFFDTIITRENNKLTTPDGTLAGSCLDMHAAMLNTHLDLGIPLAEVSQMTSKTPATFLNLRGRGQIAVGQRADFLLIDNQLQLTKIWQAGQLFDPN